MSEIQRYFALALFTGLLAGFLTAFTIGLSEVFSGIQSKYFDIRQRPRPHKIIKNVLLFLGQCLGVWLFWVGFGIGMTAGNNESSWVMTYSYFCLWITIPIVSISYFTPLLGGLALIANSIWSRYLLNRIFLNSISAFEQDQIFSVKNGHYNLGSTQLLVSGPLLLLGSLFLILGLFGWLKPGNGERPSQ